MTLCTCRTCSCSEEEIAAYHAATGPLQKALDEFEARPDKNDHDLAYLCGRVFRNNGDPNVVALLERATEWIQDNCLTLNTIRYDNTSEGGFSESITVIAES